MMRKPGAANTGIVNSTSAPVRDGGYDIGEQLSGQVGKLPSPEMVEELCSTLRVSDLRQLTAEILNASIAYIRDDSGRLEYVTLLNSWIATAEETVAAGRNVNRIAARRRSKD